MHTQFTRKQSKQEFCDKLVAMVPRLRRFAIVLTGSTQDGEDLVQSSLERAINKRAQFRHNHSFEGWVFSILKSSWKNEVRSRVVRNGNGTMDAYSLTDTSPDNDQEQETSRMQLREALMRLPDHHKEAIALVDIEGLSYKEAADILQIPTGTLMSRLARGRDTLLLNFKAKAHTATVHYEEKAHYEDISPVQQRAKGPANVH